MKTPEWLRIVCVVMILACVPTAAATVLVVEFGRSHLYRAAPDSGNAEGEHQAAQYQEHEERQDESHWYGNPDWWIAGFTGLLFTATTALWLATWRLWVETRRAVQGEEQAIKAALENVKESARAADEMARVAVAMDKNAEIAKGTVNAMLDVAGFTRDNAAAANDTAEAMKLSADAAINAQLPIFKCIETHINPNLSHYRISFRPMGGTPVTVVLDCLVVPLESVLPDVPRYPLQTIQTRPWPAAVWGEQAFDIIRPSALLPHHWQPFNDGQSMWIYGYFEYIDFLKRRMREGFCFQLRRVSGRQTWSQLADGPYVYSKQVRSAENHKPSSPS